MDLRPSYIDGDWTSPDLTAVFDVAIANEDSPMIWSTGTVFSRAVNRVKHLSRANTRRGSRRNIAYHYDLGNAFYSTMARSDHDLFICLLCRSGR